MLGLASSRGGALRRCWSRRPSKLLLQPVPQLGRRARAFRATAASCDALRPPVTSFTEEEDAFREAVATFAAGEIAHRVRTAPRQPTPRPPRLPFSLFAERVHGPQRDQCDHRR
jgi:hypothetical protein